MEAWPLVIWEEIGRFFTGGAAFLSAVFGARAMVQVG